jgi:multiple RNA-binding domain-containing protein 1
MPEHAVQAYTELNGTMFQGRMFHILPAKTSESKPQEEEKSSETNFKDKKLKDLKKTASLAHNWNTLFMGPNVVADVISRTYGRSKEDVLGSATGGSEAAVRLALGETQIVLEMKKFLEQNGVRLEAFEGDPKKRSKTVILVKNLPSGTNIDEIRTKFAAFGVLEKVILPPSGVTCLVKFADPSEARKAFKKLAYSRFKHVPLYLEWAPENVFTNKVNEVVEEKVEVVPEKEKKEIDDTPPENDTTLFIKNLNFQTNEEQIRKVFSAAGPIHTIQIAKKIALDGKNLSLGYGFIQYKHKDSAEKALKNMQYTEIDLHTLELKRSDRTISMPAGAVRKGTKKVDQKESTKIMVRNVPFQANAGEVRQLFQTFGELKGIRLPKKAVPGPEQHRGFGFVDFVNKSDAKNAFEALSQSTHLYGRRLVLEWASTSEDLGEIRKRTAEESVGSKSDGNASKKRKGFVPDEKFIKTNENENENEEEVE